MHSQRWVLGRLCAASIALALSACGGGGGTDTASDMQSGMSAGNAAIESASAHDATTDHFGRDSNFVIRTLGNRADLISDGDALVEVQVPKGVALDKVKVTLNGANITGSFTANAGARTLRGVVTGLRVGKNELAAQATNKGKGREHGHGFGHDDDDASLTITNHPRGGPVLLGSQTTPWSCATPNGSPESGDEPAHIRSGLSGQPSADGKCNIATEFKLWYHTTAACANVVPDPNPTAQQPNPPANACLKAYTLGVTPADLAMTTTNDGKTVPYIVRVERGTMNRGIYEIVVLFDPTKPWTPLAPQPQWNGKVVYTYGASTGQTRLQNRTEQNWADDSALSRGFMVVDNSLTDSLYNSNRTLVAETTMMMKEHIVDTYGEIKYMMGNGCSGGSIQQNTVASIYPGLLDGIQPSCDYPDSITTGMEVGDCVLLVNFYDSPAWKALQPATLTQAEINAKKTAINGHFDHTACQGWYNSFGNNNRPGNYVPRVVINNTTGATAPFGASRNNCVLPATLVYDPVAKPDGTRCGDPDLATAVWGTTDNENATGNKRALQTGDNVGIQYGLKALLSGAITAEEFVTLNEKIGGTDADSNATAARTTADLPALRIAYRAGIVSSGRNLGKLPIIDSRGFDEAQPPTGALGIHLIWRTYAERARIEADNRGNHGNQIIWRYGTGLVPGAAPPAAAASQVAAVTTKSFLTMDAWLTTLLSSAPKETINSVRTQAQVIAAKPTDPTALAFDLCYLTGDDNFAKPITDMALCDADPRLAKHSSPRQVAGGPLAENVLKCRLRPINTADYLPATFTADQLNRLYATFPDGVCDWSKPGVGQQPARSPLTFANGPGGHRLPPAPGSNDGWFD